MVEKLCRLCLKKKSRSMGIFTAKGIKQKIAEIIRMHFLDKVTIDDRLPKLICLECWTKLENFHEFYVAVDMAKNMYLKYIVKSEVPEIVEINYDAIECDDDSAVVKVETVEMDMSPQNQNDFSNDCFEDGEFPNKNSNTVDVGIANESKNEVCSTGELDANRGYLISNYLNMICQICEDTFDTLAEFRTHCRRQHNKSSIKVKCCDRKIPFSDISDHIECHLYPDKHKCDKCNKYFVLSKDLKGHLKFHLPKLFECDICKKRFAVRHNLKDHILMKHRGDKKPKCKICQKCFVTEYSLKSHVRNVHERTPRDELVCHICAKVYHTSGGMKNHLQKHNGIEEPRLNCDICGNSLKNKKSLQKHMTMHKDEGKSYPCPTCHKISPTRYALANHIKAVHNYKTHKCHLCDKECKSVVALKEHMATHSDEYLYNCVYCPKAFKSHSNMFQHFRKSHPIEWSAVRKTKPKRNQ